MEPPIGDSSAPSQRTRRWSRRAGRLLAVAGAVLLYRELGTRPEFLPLASRIDGPAPAKAAGVVVFLHGLHGSLARGQQMAEQMRAAGLPADFAIVLVEGPYPARWGHHWGGSAEEQAKARARLRARLTDLVGDGHLRGQWIIAGFSQGAGVALDMAVEDPRIGAVASFSPCYSWLRGELPKRDGLRFLLAHGSRDSTCPVEESQSLARVLKAAQRPVQYIEFGGEHTVPSEVWRAFVAFATGR